MEEIRIGLLGFGTVGAGVVKCLHHHADLIAQRTGVRPVLAAIADLDLETDRGVPVDRSLLTTDAQAVIADPSIQIIIELVGGTGIAKTFVRAALEAGKSVVTANKALLAHHGEELFALADESGGDLYYEASVAGGIPILKALREGLVANQIEVIYGILNGTCNYIMTRMEREQVPFADVLAEAQRLGYAEAEPSLDIDGMDTAHKTVLLAALAFGKWFDIDQMHVEGIRDLDLCDVAYAAAAGYKLKVLGILKPADGAVEMRVHPTLIPASTELAAVSDVYNAVFVRGDVVGNTLFYGRGAGMDATASAVVADVVDVALNLARGSSQRVAAFREYRPELRLLPMAETRSRYYLRLQVLDEPGVLARTSQVFGQHGISIASVHQKELGSEVVPVIFTTHLATEANLRSALAELEALNVVHAKPVLLRIEDL